jgi:vacuolar-type H+-ATPase subunit C/Vma6
MDERAPLDAPTADARARGLATRLLSREELESLAGSDLRALTNALARGGRLEPIADASPASIEAAARRTAAKHLRVLSRWSAGPALEAFFAEQDRRIVRAMLRGASSGTPADERAAGLLPTPLLPERAIAALSREPTAARVAAHLVVLGYPGAARLGSLASRAHPVPFELDLALLRDFAERASRSARRGDRALRDFVAWILDTENAISALAIVASPRDVTAKECFVAGGTLSEAAFLDACAADSRIACAERLARGIATPALAKAVRESAGDPVRLERASLTACIEHQKRRARLDPLSSAPLLGFLLRLAAMNADVRRLAWGASLGAPAALVRTELAMPWS